MATSLSAPRCLPAPIRSATISPSASPLTWLIPAVLLVAALVVAGCLYMRFLDVHRSLWEGAYHDRDAHYLYSLKLATDVRNGQVFQLLSDLNEGRIWPPLHGLLAGTVLLVGGLDYRLAVLPSLAGWVVAVIFGFLLARRCVPRGGTFAGLIAVLFIAASPAHRAYATDIMLESLGAALSLVALYAYLLTVQGREDEKGKAPACLWSCWRCSWKNTIIGCLSSWPSSSPNA